MCESFPSVPSIVWRQPGFNTNEGYGTRLVPIFADLTVSELQPHVERRYTYIESL